MLGIGFKFFWPCGLCLASCALWLTTGSFLLLCRAFVSLSAASVKSMVRVVLSTCDSQLSTQPHVCFYIFFNMVAHSLHRWVYFGRDSWFFLLSTLPFSLSTGNLSFSSVLASCALLLVPYDSHLAPYDSVFFMSYFDHALKWSRIFPTTVYFG